MTNTTLCYLEKDGCYLMLHRVKKKQDLNAGKWIGIGGHMEEGESPKECALRETWEEIGIPEQSIRVVNRLDTIYTYSNFAMFCYLGIIDESALDGLRLNEDEVESVFTVSIDWLLENEPDVFWTDIVPEPPEDFPYEKVTGGMPYEWRKGKAPVPVYREVDGSVIWGLTARITKRFTDVIRESRQADVIQRR